MHSYKVEQGKQPVGWCTRAPPSGSSFANDASFNAQIRTPKFDPYDANDDVHSMMFNQLCGHTCSEICTHRSLFIAYVCTFKVSGQGLMVAANV